MFYSDTNPTYTNLPILSEGTDKWYTMYAVSVPRQGRAGDEFLITGKIQVKCYEGFAVEFCAALCVGLDKGIPLIQTGAGNAIHPVTGENVSSDMMSKYAVFNETAFYRVPVNYSTLHVALKVRARSTDAIAASRLKFGNGMVQARLLAPND